MSSPYAELFLSESREHLSTVNDALLSLERGVEPMEQVRELFRAVHSVKGMSAAMGFASVTELAHELESLLDRMRSGAVAASAEVMDALFAAADRLEEAVAAAIDGADGRVDCSGEVQRLRALASPGGDDARASSPDRRDVAVALPPGAHGAPAVPVLVRLAAGAPLPGVRAVIVLRKLEALGRVTHVAPDVDALAAGEFHGSFELRIETDADAAAIEAAARSAGDVAEVVVGDRAAGEEPGHPGSDADSAHDARPGGTRPAARSVRVELRRLDALLDLAGELVIARGRLDDATADAGAEVRDAVDRLSRLVSLLQEEVLTTRLVPVWQVFDRFPRLVRDAARALGKDVELVVRGQEIELDRSLLDEIGDPLVHLLRNAVDHGIETPAERERAGKPRAGRITLSATRDRDAVLLRVEDDGRGIDRARVLERARGEGLVRDGQAVDDEELVRLVSRPGFSTAERVTEISGRGVGVDAVQSRLRALGGSMDIRSREGAGTTATLRLPITLAIIRALIARVGAETYVLPSSHVAATAELAAAGAATVRGEAALVLGGEPMPALDLRVLVGLPPADVPDRELVVLDARGRRLALVVDELVGQQDVVVKRFDTARGAPAFFGGATVLGDGMPALILDVGQLLS
ncbi:MAG TPA: chemotaxis protein CheA [Gemmatimonadales bacterium]